MFDFLFGMPPALKAILALVVVLGLIGATTWVVRRFATNRLGGGLRGRQPRLAVIDAANVDARRRLVLIRRDNIEHLLMIGGPSDLVIEPNIVRAGGVRESLREPHRSDNGARLAAPAENGWPLQPNTEPAARPRDEGWTAQEIAARVRAAEPLSGSPADFASRQSAPEFPPVSRREPRPATAAASPIGPGADHNLAEVANQLEAALRSLPEARPAPAEIPVQTVAPKPSEAPRPREVKMRIDPRIAARSEPRLDIKPEPRPDAKPAAAEAKPEPRLEPKAKPEAKSEIRVERPEPKLEPKIDGKPDAASRQDFYDNLEEEMASLLGRPTGKS